MAGVTLEDQLPPSADFYDSYAPEPWLHMRVSNMVNENTSAQVFATREQLLGHLRKLEAAPSVQLGGGPGVLLGGGGAR